MGSQKNVEKLKMKSKILSKKGINKNKNIINKF